MWTFGKKLVSQTMINKKQLIEILRNSSKDLIGSVKVTHDYEREEVTFKKDLTIDKAIEFIEPNIKLDSAIRYSVYERKGICIHVTEYQHIPIFRLKAHHMTQGKIEWKTKNVRVS